MPGPDDTRAGFRNAHPLRTAILFGVVALGPALTVTHLVVRGYRAHEESLTREWTSQAEQHLDAGRPAAAAEAFRNARHYHREDDRLQLRLAQALAAADRRAEARSYLRALWQRDPSDGAVNLELARLAVRTGHDEEAEEHYRRALEGYWVTDGAAQRRDVRIEFAQYLLARDRLEAARAELIALAALLPERPELYIDVAERLIAAGAFRTARDLFERTLRLEPDSVRARAGAGRTAFEAGDYAAARVHLLRLRRDIGTLDPHLSTMLALATDILAIDPDRPRLSVAERARRTIEVLRVGVARVEACREELRGRGQHALADELELLAARLSEVVPNATAPNLRRDPDAIPGFVDLAFEAVRVAGDSCRPTATRDIAVLTLARTQPAVMPDAAP